MKISELKLNGKCFTEHHTSGQATLFTCEQCKEFASDLIAIANKCCACGSVLFFGGFWGWHEEGFRAGPFCGDCTGKPNINHEVADPTICDPAEWPKDTQAEAGENTLGHICL